MTVAAPRCSSLRATPPARPPVLQRHAPSRLSASTPLGGPGGAQISASIAAIVFTASLAQRRTGRAPGPPSTSEVARAPPRPLPLPWVFLHTLAQRPRAHPISRSPTPVAVPWDCTWDPVPSSSGLAPSPVPCCAPRPLGSTCLPPLTHRVSRDPVLGVASPPPTLLLPRLQSSVLSSQPVAPCPPPTPLHQQFSGFLVPVTHSWASAHWTWHPFQTHYPTTPTPHTHPSGATCISSEVLPVPGPWDSLVTPRPAPAVPFPLLQTNPLQAAGSWTLLATKYCTLRTNTPVFPVRPGPTQPVAGSSWALLLPQTTGQL